MINLIDHHQRHLHILVVILALVLIWSCSLPSFLLVDGGYSLTPPVIPIITGDTTTPVGIYAAGYALEFDGIDDIIRYVDTRCANDPNIETKSLQAQQGTMSVWFKEPALQNGHIIGMDWGQGPFLARAGIQYYSDGEAMEMWIENWFLEQIPREWHDRNWGPNTKEYFIDVQGNIHPTPIGVEVPGTWQHYLMTWDVHGSEGWINGYQVIDAWRDPTLPLVTTMPDWTGNRFNVGVRNFRGTLDEVQYFNRRFDHDTIRSMMKRTTLTPLEQSFLLVRVSADDLAPLATDSSGNGWDVVMGDGLLAKTPKYVVSDAPIVGTELRFRAKQRPTTLPISDPAYDVSMVVAHSYTDAVDVRLRISALSVLASQGILLDGSKTPLNPALFSGLSEATPIYVSGNQLYFRPVSNAPVSTTPAVVATLSLEVLPSVGSTQPTNRSQDVTMTLEIEANFAPTVGSGGLAISCDGIDDFLYTPKFSFPVGNYSTPYGWREGSGPITIEFWAYVDDASEIDGQVFSIGAQNEVGDTWATGNPYQQRGRFIVQIPTKDGKIDYTAGETLHSLKASINELYGSWFHVAILHSGASGTRQEIWINGKLRASGNGDYDGLANPQYNRDQLPVPIRNNIRGLSVCTWMYWSDIWHKGMIDEFRIWTTLRTEEELQQNMYRHLTGTEPNLHTYYDFNDGPTEYAITGDEHAYIDRAGKSEQGPAHLVGGGCGPCEDDYMGYVTSPPPGVYLPGEIIGITTNEGTGKRVCVPSAQDTWSPFFDVALVWGGLICYGGNVNPKSRPARVESGAPLAGFQFPIIQPYDAMGEILLNATDVERDLMTILITRLPSWGSLFFTPDFTVTMIPINSTGTALPYEVKSVWYRPGTGGGGSREYVSFGYSVKDDIAISNEANITIGVPCPAGYQGPTTVNPGVESKCEMCPIGSFKELEGFQACTPCPLHTYSESLGSTKCKSCPQRQWTSTTGSTACVLCPTTTSDTDLLRIYDSRCEQLVSLPIGSEMLIVLAGDEEQSEAESFIQRLAMGPQKDWVRTTPTSKMSSACHVSPSVNFTVVDSTPNVQLMAYATSIPREGELFHAESSSTMGKPVVGTLSTPTTVSNRASITATKGLSLSATLLNSAEPLHQWVSCIISSSPSRPDRSPLNLIGPSDVTAYGTSNHAWSPASAPGNNDLVYVEVEFETPVYTEGVEIVESAHPGTVYRIEAYYEPDDTYFTMWSKSVAASSDQDAPFDAYYAPSLQGRLYHFIPDVCPTMFQTQRLRITLWLATINESPEIDAIALIGSTQPGQTAVAWVNLNKWTSIAPDSQAQPDAVAMALVYTPATPDTVGGSSYSDSFSYVIKSCTSVPFQVKRTVSIGVHLQPRLVTLAPGIGFAFLTIACLGLVVTLFMVVIVLQNMNAPIFKASSSPFLVVNLLALALLFIQSLLINLQGMFPDLFSNPCIPNSFIFGCAISILLGTLLAKSLRLHIIFNAKVFKSSTMSDTKLFILLAGIYAVDLIINIVWATTDPMQRELKVNEKVAEAYYRCTSSHYAIFEGLHYASKSFLLAWLLFVSFKVRNIPSRFNEAKSIGMVAYNAAFFAVLAIVVLQFLQDNVNASYAIENFGLLTVGWGCIGFFYANKFYTFMFRLQESSLQTTDFVTQHAEMKSAGVSEVNNHSITPKRIVVPATEASGTTITQRPSTIRAQTANKSGGPAPLPRTSAPMRQRTNSGTHVLPPPITSEGRRTGLTPPSSSPSLGLPSSPSLPPATPVIGTSTTGAAPTPFIPTPIDHPSDSPSMSPDHESIAAAPDASQSSTSVSQRRLVKIHMGGSGAASLNAAFMGEPTMDDKGEVVAPSSVDIEMPSL